MIGDTVIFKGEYYYAVAESLILLGVVADKMLYAEVVAINKIETASPAGISRASWVSREEVIKLPSGMEFKETYWFKGVQNGSAK